MKLKDRLKKKKEEPVTISVRIPFELDQWVRACANKYGVTITDVVIATIEEAREEMLKSGDWR